MAMKKKNYAKGGRAMKSKGGAMGGKRKMMSKGGAMGGKRKMMSKGGAAGGKIVRGPNSQES